jgi:transcriptional regulator with XRE-family HTH domain
MDREALADFLARRRRELQPDDVGLPAGLRRRTPGLRREEVALLSAMSVDYYTRLEQRRGPQPSTQLLTSLARALRLTADERDYLFRVAGHNPPDRAGPSEHVAPALLRVLGRLSDTPALILNQLAETLAQNAPARALFGDAAARSGWDRSEIYRWFMHPATERCRYPEDDRGRQSRAQVASLRMALSTMGKQSRAGRLVDELQRHSPEFVELWDEHQVARRFADQKILIHPEIGPIELDCQVLFTEDQSQALLVLTAEPRTEDEEKLRLLNVVGTQTFTP